MNTNESEALHRGVSATSSAANSGQVLSESRSKREPRRPTYVKEERAASPHKGTLIFIIVTFAHSRSSSAPPISLAALVPTSTTHGSEFASRSGTRGYHRLRLPPPPCPNRRHKGILPSICPSWVNPTDHLHLQPHQYPHLHPHHPLGTHTPAPPHPSLSYHHHRADCATSLTAGFTSQNTRRSWRWTCTAAVRRKVGGEYRDGEG
ncbi:hypothetical protein R3P38DRAFT_548968 [Favolaschia claudopus]|uniref:Uncharacterized protein n=1 Tax=Favolaschia claudopus TaxID=2862362 RepID=A0AAW0CK06_9AGAR